VTTLAKRPCAFTQGCTERVESGFCEKHGGKWKNRRSASAGWYDTAKWKNERKRFISEFPLCGMRTRGQKPVMSECHAKQLLVPAKQVDHVVPHRGDEARFWDRDGWQSLCASCGAKKSRSGL